MPYFFSLPKKRDLWHQLHKFFIMKTNNYFKKIAIAAMGLFAFNIQANNLKHHTC